MAQLAARTGQRTPAADSGQFRIEPLEGRVLLTRFAVLGDFASFPATNDVANRIKSWSPEFIVTVGDNNNYPTASPATIDASIGQFFHDYISPYKGTYGPGSADGRNRFFPALGNHDWDDNAARPYFDYFSLPNNERYYTVQRGDVGLFVVDSDGREPDGNTASSAQANWLRNAMAASTARWKFVFVHHPPYSSGGHGNHSQMQWPFAQWGATAVFSGHDHDYERIQRDGIAYFVDGLGGAARYDFGVPVSGSAVRYNADHGAMLVDTTSTSATFKFITRGGQTIDTYSVSRPAPAATYISAIPWSASTNGWGPAERDRNVGGLSAGDGGTIRLAGVRYAKGLGVHASSRIDIDLGGQYGNFLADVGVDDAVTRHGSVVFNVLTDGALRYYSPAMTAASATQFVNVPLAGARRLSLLVTTANDGNICDWADWANARLTAVAAASATTLSGAKTTVLPAEKKLPALNSIVDAVAVR